MRSEAGSPADPVASAGSGRGLAVSLEGVSRAYRRGQETVHALDDVSLTLRPGELTLVLGPSGGGKSTLLHLLGGMDRPSAGRVVAGQVVTSQLSADRLSAWRRTHVGFVFQSFHLLPHLTAAENVGLPLVLGGQGGAQTRKRAAALLERVGLGDRAGHRPGELSGGQAQRVAVARALAADPPIVLADEPTGQLDTQSGQEITTLLRDLAHQDGRTVVVVSHNEEFAALADRVIRVRDGHIVNDSAPDAPAAPPAEEDGARGRMGPSAGTLMGMAGSAARRRAWRSVLTGLGVTVGVAAMVLLVSIGAGLEHRVVTGVLDQASLNSVLVSQNKSSAISLGKAGVTQGTSHPIGSAQIATFSRLPGVRAAYTQPVFLATGTVSGHSGTLEIQALPPSTLWSGTTGVTLPTLVAGKLPGTSQPGIVLPQSVADALFGVAKGQEAGLVGKTVQVTLSGAISGASISAISSAAAQPQTLVLTGVSKASLGSSAALVRNALALHWVALSTPKGVEVNYGNAVVVATSTNTVNSVAKAIGAMGFGTTTAGDIVSKVQKIFGVLETALGIIGGIALVVAGLMIAVVMSMAVLERSGEIGVLRALGARRRDVFTLFLSEAAFIGLAGGVVGDVLGWALGKLGAAIFHQTGIFLVPLWLVLLGLGFGAAVAIVAGAVPAGRAARLNPVGALRAE